MSEMAFEEIESSVCPLCGHILLCVLSTMLEVNCALFDNILLAGSTMDTPCQSLQGTLAVSRPLLKLRVINGMLMCSRVNALVYMRM